MVLEAAGTPLKPAELPEPQPGPGQVALRVIACAVCRTDLHIFDGELTEPKLPLVLGHQVVGEVVGAGEGSERFAPGDRVGLPWLAWADGECRYCRSGRENLCPNAKFTGYDVDGGYAEVAVADERYCLDAARGRRERDRAVALRGADRLPGAAHVRRRRARRAARLRRLGAPHLPGRRARGTPRVRGHPRSGRRQAGAGERARGGVDRGRSTRCRRSSTRRSSSPPRGSWSRRRCGRWRREAWSFARGST